MQSSKQYLVFINGKILMKWKTLDLYIMNFSKINLQNREWIKKLNINHFWDLSFLICNAVLQELPTIPTIAFFELGKSCTEKIIKYKMFLFKNVINADLWTKCHCRAQATGARQSQQDVHKTDGVGIQNLGEAEGKQKNDCHTKRGNGRVWIHAINLLIQCFKTKPF